MSLDLEQVRFFVDESTLGVGKALVAARRDVIHVGHPRLPEIPYGTLDETWIPEVARRGWIVIARDRRIRSKPAELELMRSHGLRGFWLAGKRDRSVWDYIGLLHRRWDAIEQEITTRGPGPWFVASRDGGFQSFTV